MAWVEVSNHAYEQWKKRRPDGCVIGPRVAWDESILVPEDLWSDNAIVTEVWLHESTKMLLLVDEAEDHKYIKTAYRLGGRDWHDAIYEWLENR